jgi:hypothetical protein
VYVDLPLGCPFIERESSEMIVAAGAGQGLHRTMVTRAAEVQMATSRQGE